MIRSLLVPAAVLCAALPARAATVLDVPLERMAKESPVVVEGIVASRESRWTEDRGRIVTFTRIKVTRAHKGVDAPEILLWQGGGTVGRVTHALPGDATFEEGEEVLLFLEPHPREQGAFVLVAMAAAKFSLERTADGVVARRALGGLGFARADSDGVIRAGEASGPGSVPLEELRATIERALR